MNLLKKEIKQILVRKQHKNYAKQVSEKKLTYSEWIAQQEEKIKIDNIIMEDITKSLTNEILKDLNGGENIKNAGFYSKYVGSCRYWRAVDKEKDPQKVLTFLFFNLTEFPVKNIPFMIQNIDADVILLAVSEGEISSKCIPLLYNEFSANKNLIMIYGDEDVMENGVRRAPWFKPDWSPDTFLSTFYFGSFLAVKRCNVTDEIKRLNTDECWGNNDFKMSCIYPIVKRVLEVENCFAKWTDILKSGLKIYHIPEILFHTKREGYEQIKKWKLTEEEKINEILYKNKRKKQMISVIVPSRDNPGVLFTCISSLVRITDCDIPYEILIIDNGSSEENRQTILQEIEVYNLQKSNEEGFRGITYHYEPMDFNFSRMCNLGAEKAKGDLLLFLNDDMEILSPEWLSLLADKALLPYAGAVGAKLLYPDSAVIQHAGITNLRVGPAHKLQFLSDEEEHYYGRNLGVHNMLAVTGACLMVRTAVFRQVGGFAEKLAVAFNDVDLCYRIYEEGYYNIQRNDVKLFHHESLSRGKDGESAEKQQRLLKEKDILYERHQEIYGKDPFYHKYLTTDMLESEYTPAFHYQVTLEMPWAAVTKRKRLPSNVKEDRCVVIGMESAMDIYKWKYGVPPKAEEIKKNSEDTGFYFQGYSFVIGADNACYNKIFLLQNKASGEVICVQTDERYRQDIKNNLSNQLNVDLTGFAAKVKMEDLPKGEYRFGMLMEDRTSRQRLVNWSNWEFEQK